MEHDIFSYSNMVKIKARLRCEGLCASVKGKLEDRDMTDRQGGEVRVEGLALMD
jgi:hypothetical protein